MPFKKIYTSYITIFVYREATTKDNPSLVVAHTVTTDIVQFSLVVVVVVVVVLLPRLLLQQQQEKETNVELQT